LVVGKLEIHVGRPRRRVWNRIHDETPERKPPTAGPALPPDLLSACLDGVCVRAVLEVDGAVPALGRNIETLLCRTVPDG
jgi:hypothetical protein